VAVVTTEYRSGTIYGTRNLFEKKDDALPYHTHAGEQGSQLAHNVIVLRGRVLVQYPEEFVILNGGEVFDFADPQTPHSITALLDNTVTLHLCLGGRPDFV
jgi:quercetin dioxygenase-like cupin family protein